VDLLLADCNNDKILDAVLLNYESPKITVLHSEGALFFDTKVVSSGITPKADAFARGEFDGNAATVDLLVGHYGKFNILKGDGKCAFAFSGHSAPVVGQSLAVGVFNLDKTALDDVVVLSFDQIDNVYHMATFRMGDSVKSASTSSAPTQLATGDFDDNGFDDVALSSEKNNEVVVRFNMSGTLGPSSKLTVGKGPRAIVTGDLNGDKRPDIVTVNDKGVSVIISLGSSFDVRTEVALFDSAMATSPTGLALADLDGDGDLDVAATDPATKKCALLTNDGKGNLARASSSPLSLPGSATRIAAGELDGDQAVDLVFAEHGGKVHFFVQSP
jgi:hypothetical protein